MFLLFDDIYAVICRPKKYLYVSIRKYYAKGNEILPTRWGIHLPSEQYRNLIGKLSYIISCLKKPEVVSFNFGFGYRGVIEIVENDEPIFKLFNKYRSSEIKITLNHLESLKMISSNIDAELQKIENMVTMFYIYFKISKVLKLFRKIILIIIKMS